MLGSSPSSDIATTRVAVGLAFVASAFLWFALESQTPWEGKALSRTAKRLEIPKEDVPWQVFFDFEALGSYRLTVEDYQQIGLWQGSVFVGLALGAAALTACWWVPLTKRRLRPGSVPTVDDRGPGAKFQPGRAGWIALLFIMVTAFALRAPYLDRAIYFDEQDNLRRNFHGYLEIQPDGTERWKGAGWSEALWENKLGNNPVLLSVIAQGSQRIWRAVTRAEREQFNIVVLRIPVFLAGMGSIAALWWLLQLWGLRLGAAFGGLLAAIHPMHIDYSLQARGYAFVLLFVPLSLGFAWLALRENRWRHWFAFAFCVFFCLWSYAGSIYYALTINAGMLGFMLWRRYRSGDPGVVNPISRLLTVNMVTGLLYLFLIAPHIPQVSYHFRKVFEIIPLESFWIFYAWSHYSTGTNFPSPADIYELRTDQVGLGEVLLGRFAASEFVLVGLQWAIIPMLIIVGFSWLLHCKRKAGHSPAALLLGLAFLAPVLALSHQHFTSLYFYYWYLSSALPIVIAGVAIGLDRLVEPLLCRKTPLHSGLAATVSIGFFAVFFWQVSHREQFRPGRISHDGDWALGESGIGAVEFQRGRHLWTTTQDGHSICELEVFEVDGKRRAGR